MNLFDTMLEHRYGHLHLATDEATGLRAIVAIHSLRHGPALGGTRCIPYASDQDALRDAIRLARGMSYKAAISNIPHGGGKAVIIRPAQINDRAALFRAFGRFVDSLNGQYITTEDSGTSTDDLDIVRQETRYAVGISEGSGDPSPSTALGVRRGIEACAHRILKRSDLDGLHVAIQGVGHVGYYLARELHTLGARLSVTDINTESVQRVVDEFGAEHVAPDAIFDVDCDIFSPCALGAILNDNTIPRLRCRVVAGAANNQLETNHHGIILRQRGIAYAPDYAINAGGLINVAQEWAGYDEGKARAQILAIYDTIIDILDRAVATDTPEFQVADAIAEARIFD